MRAMASNTLSVLVSVENEQSSSSNIPCAFCFCDVGARSDRLAPFRQKVCTIHPLAQWREARRAGRALISFLLSLWLLYVCCCFVRGYVCDHEMKDFETLQTAS
jgi:hypothetical protein